MSGWRIWNGLWYGVVSIPLIAAFAAPARGDEAEQFDTQFRPLLTNHCVSCHSGDKPKGNLRLDNLAVDLADDDARKHWTAVVERLQAGDMPPKEKPRPPEKDVAALTAWLAPRLTAADSA